MATVTASIHARPEDGYAVPGGRILELDGVRAIAIALVIGAHYAAFASSLWRAPEFGWAGVEIFFVLSGYLITTNLLALKGRRGAYRVFYARRARRILPPYFLTVAGCFLIAFLGYAATRNFVAFHRLFRLFFLYAFFLPSFSHTGEIVLSAFSRLRTGDIFAFLHAQLLPWIVNPGAPRGDVTSALSPTWSLSVEEWFYILWAPLVLAFRRRGIVFAIVLSSFAGLLLRWLGPAGSWYWYTDFFCRLDTLALGAALALWLQHRKTISDPRKIDRLLSGMGFASMALFAILLFSMHPILGREIRDSSAFAAFGTPLIGATTAAALAWILRSARSKNLICRALRSRSLVYLGRRSYTIYLVHVPWCWFVSAFLGGAYLSIRSEWIAAVISLSLTLVTASLSWKLIEAPLLANSPGSSS